MGLIQDIKSLIFGDYKTSVEQTTDRPVIYINPNLFDKEYYNNHGTVNPEDLKKLRDILEFQHRGMTANLTDKDLREGVELSITTGPFAARNNFNGQDVCIVNLIDKDLETKSVLLPILAGVAAEKMREIPGGAAVWDRVIGIHEGQHCNQDGDRTDISVLYGEAEADQKAIDWLIEEEDRPDMANTLKDYRAISPGMKPDVHHATSIFLNTDGNNPDGLKELKAAGTFKNEMAEAYAKYHDISASEAKELMRSNPKDFAKGMQEVLDSGVFKENPNKFIEKMSRDYVGGINKDGFPVDAEANIITAASYARDAMLIAVSQEYGIPKMDAMKMLNKDPEKFLTALDKRLDNGDFEHTNPYLARYVEQFVDGHRNQIKDPKVSLGFDNSVSASNTTVAQNTAPQNSVPENTAPQVDLSTIKDGKPSVTYSLAEGTTMKIGEAAPSAYFASFADPSLAQQRIEMQNTQFAKTEIALAAAAAVAPREPNVTAARLG